MASKPKRLTYYWSRSNPSCVDGKRHRWGIEKGHEEHGDMFRRCIHCDALRTKLKLSQSMNFMFWDKEQQ